MAHPQQQKFVELTEQYFIRKHKPYLKILEVGSYDINGSVRNLFNGCDYTGADLDEGPGVDVVSSGHELAFPASTFDITISCECFEHNPYWRETFLNMHRMTKEGGLVIITVASKGRWEHGTKRTSPSYSPGTQAQGIDYYHNLTEKEFETAFGLHALFNRFKFFKMSTSKDLFFCGWKTGKTCFDGDLAGFSASVTEIRNMKVDIGISLWKHFKRAVMILPVTVVYYLCPEPCFHNFQVRWINCLSRLKHFIIKK